MTTPPSDIVRPTHQRRPWSHNEEQQALELLQSGLPTASIARQLGRTVRAIRAYFNSQGRATGQLRRADGGCRTMLEVARLMGVPHQMVADWLRDRDLVQAGRTRPDAQRFITDQSLLDFLEHRPAWPDWTPANITDRDWRDEAQELRDSAGGSWLTTHDIARRYCVEVNTVGDWIRRGALLAMARKRRYSVWSADLTTFIPPLEAEDRSAQSQRGWITRRRHQETPP